jgi:general nucleoside transport system permease protein
MKSPVRFERRLNQPRWLTVAVPLGSLLVALVLGAIVLLVTGRNPFSTYHRIFERGFGSQAALSASLVSATPLAFTGLCAAVAFRMGIVNIGGEGQLIGGAIGASWAGIAMGDQSAALVFVAMLAAGALGGAIFALVAGVLRARFNTNEIITTLMLNYLAGILLNYLIFNSKSYWRDPRSLGFPAGKPVGAGARWQAVSVGSLAIPKGFIVAVVVAVLVWVLYRKTRFGFEVSVVADSPSTARYAGISTRRKILSVMALSGALAGMGGASDVGDFRHLLDAKGLQQSGYGYTGIVVAALARLNPLATLVVAILMGGLTNAGYALQGPDFPSGLVGTLQGLILFTAVAGEVFTRYRLRWVRSHRSVETVVAAG